ncbi:MAG: YdeI/OmpD-associated family protein [Cyclobacteriaceae bacterium]
MIKNIECFFEDSKKWKAEYAILRKLILETGLEEDFKWGKPCYSFQGKNVVLMHGFKEYCALLFHKGALLKDTENILIQQTENVQAARQIRFISEAEIKSLEPTIKAYIFEAIEVEKAGLEVKMKKTSEYNTPEELQSKFKEVPGLEAAFQALTPGRQRGYLLHFSQPKQSKTRESRIEKCTSKIFEGKGLNDRP